MLGIASCVLRCNPLFQNYLSTFTNPVEADAMIPVWKSGRDSQKNEDLRGQEQGAGVPVTRDSASRSEKFRQHWACVKGEHRCQFRMGALGADTTGFRFIYKLYSMGDSLILSNARLLRVQNGTEVYFKEWKYAFKTVPTRVSAFIKINVWSLSWLHCHHHVEDFFSSCYISYSLLHWPLRFLI